MFFRVAFNLTFKIERHLYYHQEHNTLCEDDDPNFNLGLASRLTLSGTFYVRPEVTSSPLGDTKIIVLNDEYVWMNIYSPEDITIFGPDPTMKSCLSFKLNLGTGKYPNVTENHLLFLHNDDIEKFEEFVGLEPGTLHTELLAQECSDK